MEERVLNTVVAVTEPVEKGAINERGPVTFEQFLSKEC